MSAMKDGSLKDEVVASALEGAAAQAPALGSASHGRCWDCQEAEKRYQNLI